MRATAAGLGARAALTAEGSGIVVAWFRRACYVDLAGMPVTLVAPDVHLGPTHLVLDGPLPRATQGAAVSISAGSLSVGSAEIDAGSAVTWRGELPSPPAIRSCGGTIARAARAAAGRSALLEKPFGARALRARDHVRSGRLAEAGAELAGLGPGLTPSGDDALAGVLFALRAALGKSTERATCRVAASAAVGPVSRGYLAWAARGQALAPAHDLLVRAAVGDRAGAERSAVAMARVGETSGADFLLGMVWGLEPAYDLPRSDLETSSRR